MPVASHHEDLPFAPGSSPFHLKGVVYRAHCEYVAAFIPGGEQAVNAMLTSPELRRFFEQRFLASSWYDALPIVPIWHACALALQMNPVEFLRVRTRHQARQDIHGVYRLILNVASPHAVATRLPRVMLQYFYFGSSIVRPVRPGVLQLGHTGFPTMMTSWFSVVSETYATVALEIAGARNVLIRRLPTESAGTAHGVPLSTICSEFDLGT